MSAVANVKVKDWVMFHGSSNSDELYGTVVRVWDRPLADRYVTIVTEDGQTYVRSESEVNNE